MIRAQAPQAQRKSEFRTGGRVGGPGVQRSLGRSIGASVGCRAVGCQRAVDRLGSQTVGQSGRGASDGRAGSAPSARSPDHMGAPGVDSVEASLFLSVDLSHLLLWERPAQVDQVGPARHKGGFGGVRCDFSAARSGLLEPPPGCSQRQRPDPLRRPGRQGPRRGWPRRRLASWRDYSCPEVTPDGPGNEQFPGFSDDVDRRARRVRSTRIRFSNPRAACCGRSHAAHAPIGRPPPPAATTQKGCQIACSPLDMSRKDGFVALAASRCGPGPAGFVLGGGGVGTDGSSRQSGVGRRAGWGS